MVNGRLPASALAPIAGGQLERAAAAAWNAMNAESQRRFGVTLRPLGAASSYRTLDQQRYLWDHVSHPHDTNWVAYPGTSNHGLGLAVDLATKQMRAIIDRIGARYGWAKKWSDAPKEWWHIKYRAGVWKGRIEPARPTLHKGQTGPSIRALQRILRAAGFKSVPGPGKKGYGYFGASTHAAVKRVQRKHHLPTDGVVGAKTWAILI